MTTVNTPQIEVLFIKTVSRKANSVEVLARDHPIINLTPFLNEGSSVSTNKAVNDPNGGFTIRLGDQRLPVFEDSIYAVVEPMDVVEIRMSRVGEPKIVMRGIVTGTSVVESIGSDSKPSRIVTITGGDYGCILRMIQILFVRGASVDALLHQMTGMYLQEMFGIKFMRMTGGEFIQELVDKIINTFIAGIDNSSMPPLHVSTVDSDPSDNVFPNGYQANPQGTMWSQIQKHGNLGPFNELVINDDERRPTLVYRKPPYKSLATGDYIFPTTSAESFNLPPKDITSITRSRSEHEVSNYYYVRNPRAELQAAIDTTLQAIVGNGSKLSKADYPACDVHLYGFRAMEVETNHSSFLSPTIPGQAKAPYKVSSEDYAAYMLRQVKYLQDCNVDNVLFESGTIQCNGSPEFKPGMYFETDWGHDNKESGYVTRVTHTFEPFRGYTCNLQFIRGTGFVTRSTTAYMPYFYGSGAYE